MPASFRGGLNYFTSVFCFRFQIKFTLLPWALVISKQFSWNGVDFCGLADFLLFISTLYYSFRFCLQKDQQGFKSTICMTASFPLMHLPQQWKRMALSECAHLSFQFPRILEGLCNSSFSICHRQQADWWLIGRAKKKQISSPGAMQSSSESVTTAPL